MSRFFDSTLVPVSKLTSEQTQGMHATRSRKRAHGEAGLVKGFRNRSSSGPQSDPLPALQVVFRSFSGFFRSCLRSVQSSLTRVGRVRGWVCGSKSGVLQVLLVSRGVANEVLVSVSHKVGGFQFVVCVYIASA